MDAALAFTGAPGLRLAAARPARIRTGRSGGAVMSAAPGDAAPAVGADDAAAGVAAAAAAATPTGLAADASAAAAAAAAAVPAAAAAPPLVPDDVPAVWAGVPWARLARSAGAVAAATVLGSAKLAQVPVFAVTNAGGQPYLANVDGAGTQVGLIFFSHEEALSMQADMQKSPTTADARVYIMGLDKAYEMVKAKPTPSGIRGPAGEELRMVFRFSPDRKQVGHAARLLRAVPIGGGGETAGVPVFAAPGLTLRKAGEPVVPLFLAKEDMESGVHPELARHAFVAPTASTEYMQSQQGGASKNARMHQNPLIK
ncbi:hypothetical protein BU14_0510s0017 [Porphyra umbilicalis]|uniref:Uncharacterized protein n=1 Tax=Porphyra umbilicalis TaxID=2786 RepID=A0A1X6NSW5_PORUM|nr:hypothetical protein BU14_0510s0017 [Porphyra umbilicalis]|eukprot:OSX71701.1 hypothetical protein BU14_0510s0017 [Porphyra umbilicalis]